MHKAIKTVLIMALAVSAANSLRAQTLTGVDVGSPQSPGSTTLAGGKYTVVGGGADIWGASDVFHYAYMPVTGDFDYVVQVESLVGNVGDGGWSKAELMARLPASGVTTPDGPDPFLANMVNRPTSDIPPTDVFTGTAGVAGVNNRGPQWRAHRAGDLQPDGVTAWPGQCSWTAPNPTYPPQPPNQWIRLERVGSVFWMYTSNDGTNWNGYNPYSAQGWDTAGSWPQGADVPTESQFDAAWPGTILLGLAVTGHYDGLAYDTNTSKAVFSNFGPYTPKPISITTQPPATVNTSANSTLTISVVATGDPVHYQWRKDGIPLTTNQTGATYSKPLCQVSDSGTYTVRVFGGGQEIISDPCVVTITVDTTPPSITQAKPLGSQTSLQVTFSEPVASATATVPGNYQFTGGVTATAAVLSADGYSVTLTTTLQALNTQYTLTVVGVQDTALPANTIAAPGNTATFTSVMLLTGYAFYERWMDASGDMGDINAFATAIADGSARPPDVTQLVTQLGCPWGAADNYNARVRTYFTPPSAGNYVFFVAGDDNCRVFLSTDENPLNKKLICQEASWSNQYDWNVDDVDPAVPSLEQSSLTFDGSEWASGPYTYIALQANTKYLIEGLLNEGGGGDGLDITFIKEGDPLPAENAASMLMLGSVISWYESPDVLPPSITAPTAAYNMTLAPGATGTISVTANNPAAGALTYQWTRNGYDIPGATSADYVIASASVLDMGQYRCKVTNKNATLTCQPCVVLVTGTGVFAIEGEDFDYNSGQAMPAASVMPYYGGAYEGLSAVRGVDYMNDDDPDNNQANAHPVYRYGGDLDIGDTAATPGVANWGATCSVEQPSGQFAITRAGEWTMTNNFKLGWVGTGNWGNYTRTFPSPAKPYHVVAAGSGDSLNLGQLNYRLGKVTAGVGTATQTVEPIGVFYGEGTGAWSRNGLIVMTETAGGAAKTVELGGTVTLRWSYDSGDSEYLVFYPATAGPTISVGTNAQGQPVLTFTGTLLGAGAVTGPYAAVAGATSPYTVTGGAGTMQFYRSSQ